MKKNDLNLDSVKELHQGGHLAAAKAGYVRLLNTHPRNIEILHPLAILCAQQEDYEEASQYLQTALKIQPDNPLLNLHLANILKIQGLYSQAAQILENILKTKPDYISALNNLGTVYYAQERFAEAEKIFRTVIEKQPEHVDAHYNLGLALTKLNKFAEAEDMYQHILLLSPDHFPARFHLANIYMRQEKLNEAIKIFLEIETSHPHHFETQTNLATCFLKKGLFNEAKLHYFKALELTPEDIQILFNLGVINMQQGYIDTAIQYYQRAIQIDPNNFAAHNNLGTAFLGKQHAGFALQHFREALRIQPSNKAIQHTIQILSQHQHLLASPPDYVKSLFDSYADHYEAHLLNALDYKVPELLFTAVHEITHPLQKQWDILDLGCGSGLCGVPFKPYAKKLVGVDLSAKMLEVASQKKIYDELYTEDLATFLTNKMAQYDVILAGDVLVYMGDLSPLFKLIHAALRQGGMFVFNTEINTQEEFKMNQSGRFSHSQHYLENLAKENQFNIISYKVAVTRTQNNEPVYGHIMVLT